MCRHLTLLAILITLTLSTANLALSNDQPPTPSPYQMATGQWQPISIELQPAADPFAPNVPTVGPAADACGSATLLNLPTDAGRTTINAATEEASDPVLACVYGTPPGPQGNKGYRTVWYKFTAPDSGLVVVEAVPITDYRLNLELMYDTIIAIYPGSVSNNACLLGAQIACSDDANGFLSRAQTPVVAGQQYLIEIADWQFGTSGTRQLDLQVTLYVPDSRWQPLDLMPLPRTRHASVLVEDQLYLIGGQTVSAGNPVRTGSLQKYSLTDGTWSDLAPLPGPDGLGYSNTSAAYLDGKIYLPSGYVGDNNQYDNTHWVYDVAGNSWTTAPSVPWLGGTGYGWVATIAQPSANRYFVSGGVTGPALQTGSVAQREFFYYQSGLWFQRASMLTGRYGHAMALLRDGNNTEIICVAGGVHTDDAGQTVILSSAECYNTQTEVWSPIGNMAVARHSAGSAVGPDGRWYVWGGTTGSNSSISSMEVYDPTTGSWSVLDGSHDLRNPARAWALGGFWDDELWVAGGHLNTGSGDQIAGLVEKLYTPEAIPMFYEAYLPVFNGFPNPAESNNSFAYATPIGFNQWVSGRFFYTTDYFDFYRIDLEIADTLNLRLEQIEEISNYDLYVYNANKFLLGSSENIGNVNESIQLVNLPAGTYYILVSRNVGQATLAYYQLLVER